VAGPAGPAAGARRRIVALACALAVAAVLAGGRRAAAEVTAEELQAAIDGLVVRIKAAQQRDGSWSGGRLGAPGMWTVGHTALAVLALSSAGLPADDPAIRQGVRYLLAHRGATVYEVSLRMMALQSVDAERYREQIRQNAEFLMAAQQESGGWSYNARGRPDNSNSQFALLGLRAAALSGVHIPAEVWRKAWEYFARGQQRDGGWSYLQGRGSSYGSMTAAGVASLYICAARLHVLRGECGQYMDTRRVETGLAWLARHFSVARNPGHASYKFYYLYGLERAGVISARRYLGRHDWYREGVEHLVGDPRALTGGGMAGMPLVRDCFVLLFLAKGNAPVLVHKARWSGRWNPCRYDAKFLVERFGELLGQRLTWQIIPLDAPLDHLRAAPVLYLSGRGRFDATQQELRQLKRYVEAGGFVLVEASDGDAVFDRTFRDAMARLFPRERLSPLPAGHPVYSSYFSLPAEGRLRLEAIGGPCWLSVLYAPTGLSCAWDVAEEDAPQFKLGINILAYVTGMEKLRGKLEQWEKPPATSTPPEAELRGAFVLGQLVHGGGWRPYGHVWPAILARVNREAGVDVFGEPVALDPDEESLFRAQLLYLTGTRAFEFSERARQKLRQYLERGGFLFAEAACGSEEFDRSFRALMAEVFPDRPLRPLPAGHALWRLGRPLKGVRYSRLVRERTPELEGPLLEHVELDGRAVVVYSRFDLCSAIAGHPCYQFPAVLEPSASELILKVLLYALAG